MKNFKKRIERLEKILGLDQPLEEPKEPKVNTSGLTFEQRWELRELFESLEIRLNIMLDKMVTEGFLDPSLRDRIYTPSFKEEDKEALLRAIKDYMGRKVKAESETDEEITENLK